MKNRLLIPFLSILLHKTIYSQNIPDNIPSFSGANLSALGFGAGTNMRTTFNMGDIMSTKGTFVFSNDPHITGSPFLNDSFLPSIFLLVNGNSYKGVKANVNLVTNDVYFVAPDSSIMVAAKGVIKYLILISPGRSKTDSIIFGTGFSPIDHHDKSTVYQVLTIGKIMFLKYTRRELTNVHSLTASPMDKKYSDVVYYYLVNNDENQIEKWKKGKDFIIEFIGRKTDLLQKFISDNNLRCKSHEDIVRIINYYNTLK
jgi:hypothetical protein